MPKQRFRDRETGTRWPCAGRILRAVDGEIVDSPFVETKEVLTGLFVVEAADLDAATAIARGCPALGHGEIVEVRPIGHG